jgi:TPR repeat protein
MVLTMTDRSLAAGEFEPALGKEELERVLSRVVPMMAASPVQPTAYHPVGPDAGPDVSGAESAQFEAAIFIVSRSLSGGGEAPFGNAVALDLLRDLAGRGHLPSFRAAGLLRLGQELGRPDPALAMGWFRRGAEAGSAESLFELARLHDRGLGTDPDPKLAQECYQLSAERGDPRGQHELGVRLARGQPMIDHAGALAWLIKAATAGYRPSQLLVALFHQHGLGTPTDPLEAARWYEAAAGAGDVEAQVGLARMCVQNPGLPGFPAKAVEWATLAANGGSVEAQGLLGKIYALGLAGVAPDPPLAVEWLSRAAEGGDGLAILNLIHIRSHGLGDLPPDRDSAVKWAMRGFELGYTPAKYVLARMYERGYVVDRDERRCEALLSDIDEGQIPAIQELLHSVSADFQDAAAVAAVEAFTDF